MAQGPYRQELCNFFAAEIPEELLHAQILADKISALGGTPAATPAPVSVVKEAREMLKEALKAEVETIDRYVERRDQAEGAGEPGLAAQFDDIIDACPLAGIDSGGSSETTRSRESPAPHRFDLLARLRNL